GIAKTVVYSNFTSVQDLVTALLAREQGVAMAAIAEATPELPLDDNPAELLNRVLVLALAKVQERPNTWRLLLLPPEGSPAEFRSAIRRHRELVIAAMDPYIGWLLDRLDLADLD